MSKWDTPELDKNIDIVVDLIKKRELIFFVGAGISMAHPSNLKGFLDLLNESMLSLCKDFDKKSFKFFEKIHNEIKERNLASDITQRIQNIPPEYFFELCKKNIDIENCQNEYYALEPLKMLISDSPNKNHYTLAQLLIKDFVPAVLTTNFDTLIEESYKNISKISFNCILEKVWKKEQFKKGKKRDKNRLIKLHGCINDLDSIIISLDQIGKLNISNKGDLLKYYLKNYFVFFTGYKGADLDIFSNLVTTECKGIFWNDLREELLIPKVRNLIIQKQATFIPGDLNYIFESIAHKIKLNNVATKEKYEEVSSFDLYSWSDSIDFSSKSKIMGEILEYIGEWNTALVIYKNGYSASKGKNNKETQNVFLVGMASIFYKKRNYQEALYCCNLIIENAKSMNDALKLYNYIDALQFIGLIKANEDIGKGTEYLIQSLKYQEELEKIDNKFRYKKCGILINIGNNFLRSGLFDEAIKNYINALEIYDEFGDINGRANVLENIGNSFLLKKEYKKSLEYYKNAEYLFFEINDLYSLVKIYYNLTILYYETGAHDLFEQYKTQTLRLSEILSDEQRIQKIKNAFPKI